MHIQPVAERGGSDRALLEVILTHSAAALGVERFLVRHFATELVSISAAVAAQFQPKHGRVFTERVDVDRAGAGTIRTTHGIPADALVFGAAGRIDTWKGFDV